MPDLVLNVPAWRRAAGRWLVLLSGLALLFTATATADPRPVAGATELQQRITSTRSGQLGAEIRMRTADREVASAKARKKAAQKGYKKAKRQLNKVAKRRSRARSIADAARRAYNVALAARKAPREEGTPAPITKRKITNLRIAKKKKKNAWQALHNKYGRLARTKASRKRVIITSRRSMNGSIARRESAEATLRGTIAYMTQLARARVDNKIDVELTRDGTTFTWPTEGRISGGYGCTNARFYPRRGSCAHFHDGIDIANVSGTPIRAMAAGVVAFVGWNPSDVRGRAFIVVVVHPNGLVSRYGHMLPYRRVKAGDVVRKGELIARMGSTGFSTGSHLHVELLSGGEPINPTVYLPPRSYEPPPKVTRQAKSKKVTKAKSKRARQRQAAKARKAARTLRAQRDASSPTCVIDVQATMTSIGDIPDGSAAAHALTAAVSESFAQGPSGLGVLVEEPAKCHAEEAEQDVAIASRKDPIAGAQTTQQRLEAERESAQPLAAEQEAVNNGPSTRVRSTSPTPK